MTNRSHISSFFSIWCWKSKEYDHHWKSTVLAKIWLLALHTIFFNFFFPKFCEKAQTTVIICDWSTMSISDYSTTVLQRLIQSPPFAHNGNFLMFKWFFIQSCTDFGGMIRSGSVCSAIYCLIFATNHAFSQAGWIIFMTMISIARLPSENGF